MTAMRLTQDQLNHFDREGWLVVEGVFDPESDFVPLQRNYSAIADRQAPEVLNPEQLAGYDRNWTFRKKFMYMAECTGGFDYQPYDISLPLGGFSEATEMYTGAAAFALLSHPRLLDLVECFIGSEIFSNPIQHIRVKVPERLIPHQQGAKLHAGSAIGTNTQWHQDNGVATEDCDVTPVITCWAPITDATIEMGCLAAIPRSHRIGLAPHCLNGSPLQIPEENIETDLMRPLPMKAGSVLFLHRHTMHRSLKNVSDHMRFSFDLRYSPTGLPTGRSVFPGFVARSKRDPESETRDPTEWARSWAEAKSRLSGASHSFNRFGVESFVC